LRLVTFGSVSLRSHVKENAIVLVGGQADLRGYAVGQFSGTSFVRSSIEIRSLPHRIGFTQVGYLAYWDAGDAASSIAKLRLHQDVGIGIKALLPQLGRSLAFLYWAAPLDSRPHGFPGRISFGFESKL